MTDCIILCNNIILFNVVQDTLDPKVRQNMEKRLATLLEESSENRKKHIEKKYAVRYHKVRFFERIKIERKIKKLKKALRESQDESWKDKLSRELTLATEDLEYILHFPKGEKYVSLLKDSEDPEAQKHLQNERNRLRLIVKQQLRDEAIINEMDEGQPFVESVNEDDKLKGSGKSTKNAPNESSLSESDGNIEDDDFFAQSLDESDSVLEASDVPEKHPEEITSRDVPTDIEVSSNDSKDGFDENRLPSIHRGEVRQTEETSSRMIKMPQGYSRADVSNDNKRRSSRRNLLNVSQYSHKDPKGPRKAKTRSSAKKFGEASLKKQPSSSKQMSKKQPLRTRAEGGRKRRKKKG